MDSDRGFHLWTQIIRGRCRQSNGLQQIAVARIRSASKSRSRAPQQVHAKVTITPNTKVGPSRSSPQSDVGRTVGSPVSVGGTTEGGQVRRSQAFLPPRDRIAQRVPESAGSKQRCRFWARTVPDAAPLKVALDQARGLA